MKLKTFILSICMLMAIFATAQNKKSSKNSTMPKAKEITGDKSTVPLIDRKLFFGNPTISGGQLSPDGKYVTFLKELNGIMNLWIKKYDDSFEKARPLTNTQRPLSGYFWTKDSRYILYMKDNDGDENMNIFAVDPAAIPAAGQTVPEARNLTPLKDVAVQIFSVSLMNPDIIFIGLNDRDKSWHDLYQLTISTGKLDKMYENKDRITAWIFDWAEKPRLAMTTDDQGNSSILSVGSNNTFTKIYDFNVSEQAYPVGWTKDNKKAYLVSNKGDVNLSTLYLMDPATGETTFVESDPAKKVDFGGAMFDENTHELISTSYTEDKARIYWRDKKWEANYNYLKSKFPGREVDFASSTTDYSRFLVVSWGDKYVSEVYAFEPATKKLTFQYSPRADMKPFEQYLSPMTPVTYKSSDGLEIPAYLTLPAGKIDKNLPTVMLVHGGPKGPRDNWGYNGLAQFLANRGYAVLQPNFRASGGFGKEFLNAGDKEWGAKMQDDVTYGVRYLIEKGIADKSRVAIMGGSYGGYATLAGLTFTPDLYNCGVDIVGPSNLFTLLESIPAYWESGRAWLYEMVGNPNTEEGKKLLMRSSPFFHADQINKPLMVIQGANDPRVKKAESDQIVVKLRDKGQDVKYLLAADEGHGFAKPLNSMAMYASIEEFLAKHLGGRYSSEMPEDVRATLAKLIVDVSKVEMPKKKDKATPVIPTLNVKVTPGNSDYTLTIETQGQNIPMELKRTVEMNDGYYKVTESTSSTMGNIEDVMEYDKQFMPIKRTFKQGQIEIVTIFKGNQATMQAMGNNVELRSERQLFADGAGFDLFLASLPLTDGYKWNLDVADITTGKVKEMTLEVIGKEMIKGSDCFKVELTSEDDMNDKVTYYIDPSSRSAMRIVSTTSQPFVMQTIIEKK